MKKNLELSDFNYYLPKKLIAQSPNKPRDHSRLFILDKTTGKIIHAHFYNIIDCLKQGDTLVLNNSKVIPARLIGKTTNGGKREIFLLNKIKKQTWQCLIGGKIKKGQQILLAANIIAVVEKINKDKTRIVSFNVTDKKLFSIGKIPTPPYIKEKIKPRQYQTIYANKKGSVAAPTAGLHFTNRLLKKIKNKGVKIKYITLHVGFGTFAPVEKQDIRKHKMHSELATIDKKTAETINHSKKNGGRIIAVGTTSARTLESFADNGGKIKAGSKWTDIFIYPGYKFKIIDGLITNFHLPKSTLLMMVVAFAGYDNTMTAYKEAIKKKYRFYSLGDGMMIVRKQIIKETDATETNSCK